MAYVEKFITDPVSPPDDIDKPFFAYGIFKEGQIAHFKLELFISEVDDEAEIEDCKLKMRDGFPLVAEASRRIVKGQVLSFDEKYSEQAYDIICKSLADDLYEWKTKTVNGREVNVLFGKDPDVGAYSLQNDDGTYNNNYDGSKDIFFNELIVFLNLESEKFKDRPFDYKDDGYDIFRLQMNYMMLWSAVDRYCKMKYGAINYNRHNLDLFSRDKLFADSLNECDLIEHRSNLTYIRQFNSLIDLYYDIRCNVVHRGKDWNTNTKILHQSLENLLKIFGNVINKTF